jgi:hypothetical protein
MVSSSSNLAACIVSAFFLVISPSLFAQDSPLGPSDEAPNSEAVKPAQDPVEPAPPASSSEVDPTKRVFGVLPNYRTADANVDYMALTAKRKLYIATKDTFDYPLFLVAGALAGVAQLNDTHSAFGQGFGGYMHRYVTAYSDQAVGNYLAEGVLPILFRQDPRYFRIGSSRGGVMYRTGYAISRLVVAKNDSGHNTFNMSEILGNSIAAGVGNAYYPGERRLGDNFERLFTSLATDGISQILKEFWPDIKRKYFSHHRHDAP